MKKDREFRGELWLLSVETALSDVRCGKCRKYLTGISRFASILLREDGEAEARKSSRSLAVRLWLHASSPLFEEVFGMKGTITEGHLRGQCPTCGRAYTYLEQPRGGDPGTLSIGMRPGDSSTKSVAPRFQPTPSSKIAPPSRPGPGSSFEQPLPTAPPKPPSTPRPSFQPPQPTVPPDPFRIKAPSGAELMSAQPTPLRTSESDTGWAGSLEHKWTAAWGDGGSFWNLIPTPEAVWTEIRSGDTFHDRPDVTALDRSTGEVVYQRAASELLGATAEIALVRSFNSTDIVFARDAGHGGHLWSLETFGAPIGLTSNAVLGVGERGNLVAALFPGPGKAPESWQNLSEPGQWTLSSLLVGDELWTATYVGPGKRIEVRRSSDFKMLWSGEYASDERIYVSADSHGWLVRRDRHIECFGLEGRTLWSCQGPELISLSAHFVVGRYPMEEAGIWGCSEPVLGGFRRQTGQSVTLPRQHFETRYCYTLGGNILWCVCGRGPTLIGYDLAARKVVKKPTELPPAITSGEPARRVQFLKCYGRDVYLTARSGHLVRWSGED